jgi:[methyl-Co(III) methanol-specific corrinoid protein]:coenzyme M methyltransferase
MITLSPAERLKDVLAKRKIDRPPVICTGGMMNAAVVDVMQTSGHTLPAGHFDATKMAGLATAVQQATGFENLGVPFCMTVEAEVLGSTIDFGSLACEPKIARERFPSSAAAVFQTPRSLHDAGRIRTVVEATTLLARSHPELPVIASLTGPISTAASLVDPMQFLRDLRKDREHAHRVIDKVSNFLVDYAQLLIEGGATAICIGDPTATGEILGPRMFEEYAVPYLNRVLNGIRSCRVPAILHVCGNLDQVRPLLPRLAADALSTDAMVNLARLKQEFPQLTAMGNLSTYLLESGPAEKVASQTERLLHDGVDIIAPACGLSTASPLENIRALTDTVRAERR